MHRHSSLSVIALLLLWLCPHDSAAATSAESLPVPGSIAPGDAPRAVEKGIPPLPTVVFEDDFEAGHVQHWDVFVGAPELQPLDLAAALSKTAITLPGDEKNAAERALLVRYLGTGKSIDSSPRRQVPFRAYFASCAVDTENPRMFVSLTLDDTSADANPDYPEVGSVFEARYDSDTGSLVPTDNRAVLPLCNESHGIAVSQDCSKVAVLCATAIEEHVSETYSGEFRDLVEESQSNYFYTNQTDNVDIIDAIPGLSQEEREERYRYNGEMWLLEWAGGAALTTEPERSVIHKGFGGSPWSAPSLAYSDADDSYGAAFATNLFDEGHGGRHLSAALMIVERHGARLNLDDRGWGWLCADGHVFNARAFWNPFLTDERPGEFGALCVSDGNKYQGAQAGSIGIKYESSSSTSAFEGSISYLVAANNSGVSNGGSHTVLPIDENRAIGVLAAAEMEPLDDPDYLAHIAMTEQSAIGSFGQVGAEVRGLTGLAACNWWAEGPCLFDYMRWEHSGTYPLFQWGFWWKDLPDFVPKDLSKIGIYHVVSNDSIASNIPQEDGRTVKWVAEDEDCMLGSPQLVDLRNGRYLLGYGRYQCISDGFHLRRFATGANGTRSVSTLIPYEFYLMEIDADGYALTAPTRVPGSGWGSLDAMVGLGEGRAAWAYIPSPELLPDGTFPDPEQANWELIVYQSPVD